MVKFEIYIGLDKLHHWRLKGANGEKVCWSEGYSSHQAAMDSIAWVKYWAPSAPTYNV